MTGEFDGDVLNAGTVLEGVEEGRGISSRTENESREGRKIGEELLDVVGIGEGLVTFDEGEIGKSGRNGDEELGEIDSGKRFGVDGFEHRDGLERVSGRGEEGEEGGVVAVPRRAEARESTLYFRGESRFRDGDSVYFEMLQSGSTDDPIVSYTSACDSRGKQEGRLTEKECSIAKREESQTCAFRPGSFASPGRNAR